MTIFHNKLILLLTVITAIAAIAFAICFPTVIDGSSMAPTLADGQHGLVVRAWIHPKPERGDIVSVLGDDGENYWMKRVIGLPGDTVEQRAGVIYINGERYDENYLPADAYDNIIGFKFTVGENEIFVLGDNRMHSYDCSLIGPLPMDHLEGFLVTN